MRLFLFATSLLAATNAFEMISRPPNNKANRQWLGGKDGSKLDYSSTTEDVPQVATTREFDAHLRNVFKSHSPPLATTTAQEEIEIETQPKKGLANWKTASSMKELKAAVVEDENRLTVVRFHAPYCAQCKRVEPRLRSFARRNPDIQFIDVAYTQDRSNRQLVSALGVPSFPFCQIYHAASLGLLHEHSMNQNHFQDITKVIESYADGGCDLPPHPNEEGIFASPYKSLKD